MEDNDITEKKNEVFIIWRALKGLKNFWEEKCNLENYTIQSPPFV